MISTHPWSTDFRAWWALERGSFRRAWVLSGVRNHIFTELNKIEGRLVSKNLDVLVKVRRDLAIQAPRRVATKGTIFKDGDSTGWRIGEIKIQFRLAPPIIAPSVKRIIGVDRFQSVSVSCDMGEAFRSLQRRLIENRIE